MMAEAHVEKAVRVGSAAVLSGTVASLLTVAALAVLARREHRAAVQPVNATSHWLHGETAGLVRDADIAHTGLGYATHHAPAVFWALPFEVWLAARPPGRARDVLRDASMVATIAAVVDYALVPRRLTPGWEAVLSKRAIGVTYVVMALGLAAGGLINQAIRREQQRRDRLPSRRRATAGKA
jgi:hypothetical protein